MPLTLAYRGGSVLRAVRLNVLSRPTRVAPLHTPARRVSLATSGRVSNASAGVVYASAVQSGKLTNSYATTAGRSKGKTSKTTRATKTTKASKASKGRKTATTGRSRTTPKPKKAPKRRVLTEKQKAARDAKKKREEIKQLLETALTPPKKLSPNAHSVGFKEKFEEARKMGGDMKQVFQRTAEMVKSMDPEDRERLQATAESNRTANAEAYETWVKSHTPLQIKKANLARRRLTHLKGKKFMQLRDDRAVKQSLPAYMIYASERRDSGDLRHMRAMDMSQQTAREWQGMTDAEKEKYKKLSADDRLRYIREHKEVYGEDPWTSTRSAKAKAA